MEAWWRVYQNVLLADCKQVVDSVWFILLVYQTKWHIKKVKLADGVTESHGHTAGQARDIVSSLVLASAD